MKVMFLDESGDHSLDEIDKSYPMFVLAGCIFDFDYYTNIVEKKVNELKLKHFGKTDIIVRSYDIRKQKGDFACLVHKPKRDAFLEDISQLMKDFEYKIIAAAINKNNLKSHYSDPHNPYHLCLKFILERAVMYLGRSDEKLIFRIESRETHNDQKLAEEYDKFKIGKHQIFSNEEIQSKLADLSFNQKSQNIAGMQIADLAAYPIGRWVLDNNRENRPFEILKNKIHSKNGQFINIGLKTFP